MSCPARVRIGATTMALVVASVIIRAQVVPQRNANRSLPSGEGSELAQSHCLDCHGADLITQQRLSFDGWSREIDKMAAWGARVGVTDKPAIVRYLAANFPARSEDAASSVAVGRGAEVLQTRCLTCHDAHLITQQRLGMEGWSREVDKMIAWGAAVTVPERTILIEYLSRGVLLTSK